MANKRRGEVEVKIGGKTRVLVFNNNSVAELDGLLGRHPLGALSELVDSMSRDPLSGRMVSTLRACLWAGLHERSPGAKIEAVGRAMVLEEFGDYLKACLEGVLSYMGTSTEELTAKARMLVEAQRKHAAGESLTEEEAKAVEEAAKADPLERAISGGTPAPAQTSTVSEPAPSKPG